MNNANVTICLTNPKSPTNVGAVLRASGCYEVPTILYTGNRYALAQKNAQKGVSSHSKKLATDTQNNAERIELKKVDCFLNEMPETAKLICVDFAEGAVPLPSFEHPEEAFYVFGPEDGSLRQDIVNKADYVVYMPTKGSLNLAAAVNVVLYDRAAKSFETHDDDLIRTSRDVNNRLKVKA